MVRETRVQSQVKSYQKLKKKKKKKKKKKVFGAAMLNSPHYKSKGQGWTGAIQGME